LMPAVPQIDFLSLAVVFILATLLGFASHAPGSLGVFDAAMLVALPQFGREQLLATLLVFRVLYFVIPFTLAISIMGVREFWMSVLVPWQERRRANGRPVPPSASSTPAPAPATVPQPVQRRKAQG
jgi:glycosyltransferase 2 family protein